MVLLSFAFPREAPSGHVSLLMYLMNFDRNCWHDSLHFELHRKPDITLVCVLRSSRFYVNLLNFFMLIGSESLNHIHHSKLVKFTIDVESILIGVRKARSSG